MRTTKSIIALAAITMSEAGSTIIRGAETLLIPAEPTQLVDTTGAGDAFAAAFLAADLSGQSQEACLKAGITTGSEAVASIGGQPG